MAKVRDQHLGVLQDKLGSFVSKIRNGKSYVASAPTDYKKSTSEGYLTNQSKFGTSARFASAINQYPNMKSVWKYSENKGRDAYYKIQSENSKSCGLNHVSIKAKVVPCFSHQLLIKKVLLNSSELEITFQLDKSLPEMFFPPYKAYPIFHLGFPEDFVDSSRKKFHQFLSLKEEFTEPYIKSHGEYKLIFSVDFNDLKLVEDYNLIVIFLALVSELDSTTHIGVCSEGYVAKGNDIYIREASSTERINEAIKASKTPKKEPQKKLEIRIV
ncbi:MAG: hypothetical protein WC644_05405 [Ignavibacteria bacterium]